MAEQTEGLAQLLEGATRRTVGRRNVLRGASIAAAGLAAAALIGCGSDDEEVAPATPGAAASGGTAPAGQTSAPMLYGKYPYTFPEPNKPPKAGGTIRWASASWDPSNMDPTKGSGGGNLLGPNMAYNNLLQLWHGPDLDPFKPNKVLPQLAKSWETSPDGLTHTFQITPNIKYHNVAPVNGRAFKTEDIKLAFDRYQAEGDKRVYFENVASITVPAEGSLVMKLKRPQPDFLVPLATHYTPIYPMELLDQNMLGTKAVGTGPFILTQAQGGVGWKGEANREYWENKVLLDGFDFPVMFDAAARLAAFRTKQVDYGVAASNLDEFEALLKTNPDIQIHANPSQVATFYLAMNSQNPKFADERVRQGLRLAYNPEELMQIVWRGNAVAPPQLPWTYMFDQEPTAKDKGPWWKTDLAQSKQLLTAAGAENLSFELMWTPQYQGAQQMSEVFAQQVSRVGVKANLQSKEYTVYNAEWTTRKLKEAAHGWLTLGFEPDTYFKSNLHSTSSGNRFLINDPDIDRWADEQSSELNPARRKEIHRKVWDRLYEKIYRIEFPAAALPSFMQPWVRNLRNGTIDNGNYQNMQGRQLRKVWLDK